MLGPARRSPFARLAPVRGEQDDTEAFPARRRTKRQETEATDSSASVGTLVRQPVLGQARYATEHLRVRPIDRTRGPCKRDVIAALGRYLQVKARLVPRDNRRGQALGDSGGGAPPAYQRTRAARTG